MVARLRTLLRHIAALASETNGVGAELARPLTDRAYVRGERSGDAVAQNAVWKLC